PYDQTDTNNNRQLHSARQQKADTCEKHDTSFSAHRIPGSATQARKPCIGQKLQKLSEWPCLSVCEETSWFPVISLCLTPAFAAGLERSGKPVRQHALVKHFPHQVAVRQHGPNIAESL